MRYYDASALVKKYVREAGSVKVRRSLASDVPATSRLSGVEIASGLMRRSREGAFSRTQCRRAFAALESDMSAMLIVELTPTIVSRAQTLLERHALRAGDAIQLASCLWLRQELNEDAHFVVFDDRIAAAVRAEGIDVA